MVGRGAVRENDSGGVRGDASGPFRASGLRAGDRPETRQEIRGHQCEAAEAAEDRSLRPRGEVADPITDVQVEDSVPEKRSIGQPDRGEPETVMNTAPLPGEPGRLMADAVPATYIRPRLPTATPPPIVSPLTWPRTALFLPNRRSMEPFDLRRSRNARSAASGRCRRRGAAHSADVRSHSRGRCNGKDDRGSDSVPQPRPCRTRERAVRNASDEVRRRAVPGIRPRRSVRWSLRLELLPPMAPDRRPFPLP
jgi:hypothetical protein